MLLRSYATAHHVRLDDYPPLAIIVPTSGAIRYRAGMSTVEAGQSGGGVVVSHGGFTQTRGPASSETIGFCITDPEVGRRFAPVMDEPVDLTSQRFENVGRNAPFFGDLTRLLNFAGQELDDGRGLLDHEPESSLLAELLTVAALRLVNGDLDEDRQAEPPYLKRAEEYLRAKVAEPVSLVDLCRHVGRGLRALQLAFKKHRGISPGEFLRNCRLDLARQLLTHGPHDLSVSTIAMSCGYEHFGRFSADYRRRFGELPSATKRARAA